MGDYPCYTFIHGQALKSRLCQAPINVSVTYVHPWLRIAVSKLGGEISVAWTHISKEMGFSCFSSGVPSCWWLEIAPCSHSKAPQLAGDPSSNWIFLVKFLTQFHLSRISLPLKHYQFKGQINFFRNYPYSCILHHHGEGASWDIYVFTSYGLVWNTLSRSCSTPDLVYIMLSCFPWTVTKSWYSEVPNWSILILTVGAHRKWMDKSCLLCCLQRRKSSSQNCPYARSWHDPVHGVCNYAILLCEIGTENNGRNTSTRSTKPSTYSQGKFSCQLFRHHKPTLICKSYTLSKIFRHNIIYPQCWPIVFSQAINRLYYPMSTKLTAKASI